MIAPRPDTFLGVPRYAYFDVTEEIRRFIRWRGRGTQKRLASASGLEPDEFSHRLSNYRGERFSYEELGLVAEEAGAPPGWPFLSWEDAERLERAPPVERTPVAPPSRASPPPRPARQRKRGGAQVSGW